MQIVVLWKTRGTNAKDKVKEAPPRLMYNLQKGYPIKNRHCERLDASTHWSWEGQVQKVLDQTIDKYSRVVPLWIRSKNACENYHNNTSFYRNGKVSFERGSGLWNLILFQEHQTF